MEQLTSKPYAKLVPHESHLGKNGAFVAGNVKKLLQFLGVKTAQLDDRLR
jgi:hypothetical protein